MPKWFPAEMISIVESIGTLRILQSRATLVRLLNFDIRPPVDTWTEPLVSFILGVRHFPQLKGFPRGYRFAHSLPVLSRI
jgi:hypothetical protein